LIVRGLFPQKKSKLSPPGKVAAAMHALLDTVEGKIDEKAAAARLREQVGLNWSFLTCMQYLSGKEALAAIDSLPGDWEEQGRTKRHAFAASVLAAHMVANMRPNGSMLCASHLAGELKGKTVEQWLAEKSEQ
jgi:hypothetical protein